MTEAHLKGALPFAGQSVLLLSRSHLLKTFYTDRAAGLTASYQMAPCYGASVRQAVHHHTDGLQFFSALAVKPKSG